MAFKFNPADAFDEISKKAAEAAKGAADTLGSAGAAVGETVGNAAKTVTKAAGNAASTVGENLSSAGHAIASSEAGKAVSGAIDAAGSAATELADSTVQAAQNTASGVLNFIKENSPAARLKRERMAGFKDGINQGAYLATEERFNFYYAYVATLCYFLRTDGEYSAEEQEWLSGNLEHLRLAGGVPEDVKKKLRLIAENENLTFDEVKEYLDKVSLDSLDSISDAVLCAMNLDGEVTTEEIQARELYQDYFTERANKTCSMEKSWAAKRVEESLEEYSQNIDQINEEFCKRTKLQKEDLAFLFGATLLQVARVLIINAVTEVEAAGQNNRNEKALHDFQNKVLEGFDQPTGHSDLLYASTHHIVTARGVPYDATAGGRGLFKGANHRFSTLGHDPLLGLIFGTSNIMTNSISCIKKTRVGINIPLTFAVEYDFEGKNPHIGLKVGTLEMLHKAGQRAIDEPSAAVAALIKQILHVGTDLYTPCGIQLPFANIALDKSHVEALTSYVSTGDIVKVSGQAGIAVFINWLIAALHGCSIIFKDDGEPFSADLHSVRTKKIILISNTLATSSSVIQAAITKNPKCFDLGGAIVLAQRLFSDVKFITKLKEDYLNSGLNDIYEQRAKGILK